LLVGLLVSYFLSSLTVVEVLDNLQYQSSFPTVEITLCLLVMTLTFKMWSCSFYSALFYFNGPKSYILQYALILLAFNSIAACSNNIRDPDSSLAGSVTTACYFSCSALSSISARIPSPIYLSFGLSYLNTVCLKESICMQHGRRF